MMSVKVLLILVAVSCASAGAWAAFSMLQVVNNNAGAGGFLTDESMVDLTNGAGGKLFAR